MLMTMIYTIPNPLLVHPVSPDFLDLCKHNDDVNIRLIVSGHESVSARTLHAMKRDDSEAVILNIALNANVQPETLLYILKHTKTKLPVRTLNAMVKNPNATYEVFNELANGDYGNVSTVANRILAA